MIPSSPRNAYEFPMTVLIPFELTKSPKSPKSNFLNKKLSH